MNHRSLCASLFCIALTACEPLHLTDAQIKSLSDAQLCYHYHNSWLSDSASYMVNQQMDLRKPDCHPDHATCVSYGLTKGNSDYAECRLKLSEQANQQQMMNSMMQNLQTMQQQEFNHENQQQSNPTYNNVYHHY